MSAVLVVLAFVAVCGVFIFLYVSPHLVANRFIRKNLEQFGAANNLTLSDFLLTSDVGLAIDRTQNLLVLGSFKAAKIFKPYEIKSVRVNSVALPHITQYFLLLTVSDFDQPSWKFGPLLEVHAEGWSGKIQYLWEASKTKPADG